MSLGINVRVVREISDDKLLREPIIDFLTEAMYVVHKDVAENAAVDTGQMRSSLAPGAGVTGVDKGTLTATIGTNVQNLGVSYPSVLDEAPRFHYRAGPHAGDATAGWFSNTTQRTRGDLEGLVKRLADAVRGQWKAA